MTIDFMLAPLRDEAGQIQYLIPSAVDISERKHAEQALRKQNKRLRLLWETAGILFSTDNSNVMIQGLFEKISDHLRIDTCFHFMVNEQEDALCLQYCTGIPDDAVPSLTRLEFGQAICGSVAQSGSRSWPRMFSKVTIPGHNSSGRLVYEATSAIRSSPTDNCSARSHSAAAP